MAGKPASRESIGCPTTLAIGIFPVFPEFLSAFALISGNKNLPAIVTLEVIRLFADWQFADTVLNHQESAGFALACVAVHVLAGMAITNLTLNSMEKIS